MTIENAKQLKKYYQHEAKHAEYEYYRTGDERYNDLHALALETVDLIELALCQLYQNESRKRGAIND